MKRKLTVLFSLFTLYNYAQSSLSFSEEIEVATSTKKVADLVPKKRNGKVGFVNHSGAFVIYPEYTNVGFFAEDCNLLLSPNPHVRKYGTSDYASVTKGEIDYRIDRNGKKVYTFKKSDLAICSPEFKKQRFNAYVQNGFYGLIDNEKFNNPNDYKQFTIYPQYQYLYILEGDDILNPMIIASVNDKFGIIDIHENVIIPFIYSDIKRNFSWKLAQLFEVSSNGFDYFFIDIKNKVY